MKKIYKYLIPILIVGIFASCEKSERANEFVGKNFVFFEVSSLSLGEGGTSVTTADGISIINPTVATVTVHRSGGDISQPLTVNFSTVSRFTSDSDFFNAGDDAEGTFIITNDGNLTIPSGEYSATFTITAVNDLLSSGDKEIVLTINSVSNTAYQIGVPGGTVPRDRLTANILDDDCPINIPDDWAGVYRVEDVAPAGSTNAGLSLRNLGFYSRDIDMVANESDPAGISAILSNLTTGGSPFLFAATPIVFNTCPETVTIPNPLPLAFGVSGSQARISGITSVTYIDAAKQIVILGNLTNTGGSNFGAWSFTFTKQ